MNEKATKAAPQPPHHPHDQRKTQRNIPGRKTPCARASQSPKQRRCTTASSTRRRPADRAAGQAIDGRIVTVGGEPQRSTRKRPDRREGDGAGNFQNTRPPQRSEHRLHFLACSVPSAALRLYNPGAILPGSSGSIRVHPDLLSPFLHASGELHQVGVIAVRHCPIRPGTQNCKSRTPRSRRNSCPAAGIIMLIIAPHHPWNPSPSRGRHLPFRAVFTALFFALCHRHGNPRERRSPMTGRRRRNLGGTARAGAPFRVRSVHVTERSGRRTRRNRSLPVVVARQRVTVRV